MTIFIIVTTVLMINCAILYYIEIINPRRKMKRQFIIVLMFLFCFRFTYSQTEENTYFIWDGKSLSEVHENPDLKTDVEEWQIWLYKMGEMGPQNKPWGMITGKSAASVMKQLKANQAFEKSSVKVLGPYGPMTNFNPVGPIAVIKTTAFQKETNAEKDIQQINKLYSRGQYLIATIEKLIGKNIYNRNVLTNYLDNMNAATKKLMEMKLKLTKVLNPSMQEIDFGLTQAEHNITETEAIIEKFDNTSSKSNTADKDIYLDANGDGKTDRRIQMYPNSNGLKITITTMNQLPSGGYLIEWSTIDWKDIGQCSITNNSTLVIWKRVGYWNFNANEQEKNGKGYQEVSLHYGNHDDLERAYQYVKAHINF